MSLPSHKKKRTSASGEGREILISWGGSPDHRSMNRKNRAKRDREKPRRFAGAASSDRCLGKRVVGGKLKHQEQLPNALNAPGKVKKQQVLNGERRCLTSKGRVRIRIIASACHHVRGKIFLKKRGEGEKPAAMNGAKMKGAPGETEEDILR